MRRLLQARSGSAKAEGTARGGARPGASPSAPRRGPPPPARQRRTLACFYDCSLCKASNVQEDSESCSHEHGTPSPQSRLWFRCSLPSPPFSVPLCPLEVIPRGHDIHPRYFCMLLLKIRTVFHTISKLCLKIFVVLPYLALTQKPPNMAESLIGPFF